MRRVEPILAPMNQWLFLAMMASVAAAGAQPLNVIFDTDIDGDNDDVAAAAILHAFADAGRVEIRDDGFTRWNSERDKQHFYNTQKLPIRELEDVMEQLLVQPPKNADRR